MNGSLWRMQSVSDAQGTPASSGAGQGLNWKQKAEELSPLLKFADSRSSNGEDGVLEKIFATLPAGAGWAVEFGQRRVDGSTTSRLIRRHGWNALFMDVHGPEESQTVELPTGGMVKLARERITASNLTSLLEKHQVPKELDLLVIDIDGLDYWAWSSLDSDYRPRLVVIEFNANVDYGVAATLEPNDHWAYGCTRDYGASWAALTLLAERKGYRPIHIHGCWNIYFLREDLSWPVELTLKQPLSAREFELLTSTGEAFDHLSPNGGRPSWFEAPAPDISRSPWVVLPDESQTEQVDLYDLSFEVCAAGHDPKWYQQRKTYEERASLLYPLLAAEGFKQFVDIGANVGYVSILASRAAPGLRVLTIEADPRLAAIARRNFLRHGLNDAIVVNCIAGETDGPAVPFALNPSSTLDNRVNHPGWQTTNVPMRQTTALLARCGFADDGSTFFKVDTQGFELHVLKGLEAHLLQRRDWLLKMEFAPLWLESQGTNPRALLDYLLLRYEVVEYPERIQFGTQSTAELFTHPLCSKDNDVFIEYVMSLNKNGTGWVDLLVRPMRSK